MSQSVHSQRRNYTHSATTTISATKQDITMASTHECVVCGLEVRQRQEALQCDSCDLWQHRVCGTGISRGDYRRMVRGELEAFKWYCRDCPLPVAHSSILDEETSLRDPEMPVETDLQPTPQNTSFDITLPVETGPETPMEESVEEPIPDVIMEDEPTTTYEVIVGGSVKGGDLLADNRGYTYSRKRTTDQATTWTCSNRGKKCGATVKQQGLDSFTRGSREHNHGSDHEKTVRAKARAMVCSDLIHILLSMLKEKNIH